MSRPAAPEGHCYPACVSSSGGRRLDPWPRRTKGVLDGDGALFNWRSAKRGQYWLHLSNPCNDDFHRERGVESE